MYSKVCTPDSEEATLGEKVKTYTDGVAVWLDDSDAKSLRALVAAQKALPGSSVVGQKALSTMITVEERIICQFERING